MGHPPTVARTGVAELTPKLDLWPGMCWELEFSNLAGSNSPIDTQATQCACFEHNSDRTSVKYLKCSYISVCVGMTQRAGILRIMNCNVWPVLKSMSVHVNGTGWLLGLFVQSQVIIMRNMLSDILYSQLVRPTPPDPTKSRLAVWTPAAWLCCEVHKNKAHHKVIVRYMHIVYSC